MNCSLASPTPFTPPLIDAAFGSIDATSTPTTESFPSSASYQEEAPSSGLTVGMLWVDSDSSPLKMYVYSGTEWKEIGA